MNALRVALACTLVFFCATYATALKRPQPGLRKIPQLAELTASDGAANCLLGYSVSMSGDTVVVGSPDTTIGSNQNQGAVYVFVKPPERWANMTQVAKLTASDGATGDAFGIAVSISGNTIVVGAVAASVGSNPDQGAAYIFVKPPSGWADMTETAKLTASDGAANDVFGRSVSVSGDAVLVGASGVTVNGNSGQGAAYVFVKPPSGWNTTSNYNAKLIASDGSHGDTFGWSVSLSGRTAVVGAPQATPGFYQYAGAVYLFADTNRPGALVTETAKLTASDGFNNSELGYSVAIFGTTVVAGAPNAIPSGAYVFTERPGGWVDATENAKLTVAWETAGGLGWSVDISGGSVAVGDPDSSLSYAGQGAAYLFVKPPAGWRTTPLPSAMLTAEKPALLDQFGISVSMSGDAGVAGAPYHTESGNQYEGVAYVLGKP